MFENHQREFHANWTSFGTLWPHVQQAQGVRQHKYEVSFPIQKRIAH